MATSNEQLLNFESEFKPLNDEQVGITERVDSLSRFAADFSQNNVDFQSHEVDMGGNVIKLVELSREKLPTKPLQGKKRNVDGNTIGPDPEALHFTMLKQNCSTSGALDQISKNKNFPVTRLEVTQQLGKLGTATQQVTAKYVGPDLPRIIVVNDDPNRKGSKVVLGNFYYTDKCLESGHFQGNRFSIALRNVIGERAAIEEKLKLWKEHGFVNYVDGQKFLGRPVPTHYIGKQLIAQNWEEAINLVLEPHDVNSKEQFYPDMNLNKAKIVWKKNTIGRAHLALTYAAKQKHSIEKKLIIALDKLEKIRKPKLLTESDYASAVNGIGGNFWSNYIEAYQCYIWNHIVSQRLAQFGYNPIIGDLVFGSASEIVTINDFNIKHYKIEHVVLPYPDVGVQLPDNPVIKSWYNEILGADNLTLDSFQNVNRWDLKKVYRPIVVLPLNVDHTFVMAMKNEVLIPNDYDEIKLKQVKPDCYKGQPITEFMTKSRDPEKPRQDEREALILHFTLPPSASPKVALREIVELLDYTTAAATAGSS